MSISSKKLKSADVEKALSQDPNVSLGGSNSSGTAATKASIGLGNVDNTSDVNKPLSNADTTALAGKQAINVNLTAISGLTLAADQVVYSTGAGAVALTNFKPFGRTLAGSNTLSDALTSLGLSNVNNTSDANKPVSNATTTAINTAVAGLAPLASPALSGNPTAPTPTAGDNSTRISTTGFVATAVAALVNAAPGALSNLKELADAIGDDPNFAATLTNSLAGKQALSANLTTISGLTSAADTVPYFTGSGVSALAPFKAFGRTLASASVVGDALTSLGLSNVNNTSDANKPISTATAAALAALTPVNSPAFTIRGNASSNPALATDLTAIQLKTITSNFGLIADRCYIPSNLTTSSFQAQAETVHVAMDDINALSVRYSNWYGNSITGETPSGAAATITLGIRVGTTYKQFLFGGNATGNIANGADIVSDLLQLGFTIPRGSLFYLRPFIQCSAGIVYASYSGLASIPNGGDLFNIAASGLSDTSISGTITNTGNTYKNGILPSGIYGYTSRPSYAIIGDSIGVGVQDFPYSRTNHTGVIERSIAKEYATVNLCISGEAAYTALSRFTLRTFIASYATGVISEYGTNDIIAGNQTAAQLITNLTTFASNFGNKSFYQSTLPPRTNAANTAIVGTTAQENYRTSFNESVRSTIYPFANFFDVAAALEPYRNSPLWRTDTVRTVTDGAISASSYALNSATANFTAADLGAGIVIPGAGASAGILYATIRSIVSATQASLDTPATTTVTGQTTLIGTITNDGTHPNSLGNLIVEQSGKVSLTDTFSTTSLATLSKGLIPGTGITIKPTSLGLVIASTVTTGFTSATSEGAGISIIDSANTTSSLLATKTLIQGANITLTDNGNAGIVISAAAGGGGGLTNPMTTAGDIIYGGTSGTPLRLAGNTTTAQQVLSSTGSAGSANAPVYTNTLAGFTLTGSSLSGTAVLTSLSVNGTPVTNTQINDALVISCPIATSTTLSSAITSTSATTANVASTAGYPSPCYLLIDTEAVLATVASPTSFTIQRGMLGTTTAPNHAVSASVYPYEFLVLNPAGNTTAPIWAVANKRTAYGSGAPLYALQFSGTSGQIIAGQGAATSPAIGFSSATTGFFSTTAAVDITTTIANTPIVKTTATGVTLIAGSLDIALAGQGLKVAEGTNAKQGTGVLVNGTVNIANTSVTATSRIVVSGTLINASTTIGALRVSSQTAGTGFTVSSYSATATLSAGDQSSFVYEIFEVG